INEIDDSIKYRMHYNDFPVFSSQDLSVIEQSWRDQDLHLYRRPLFSLDNCLRWIRLPLVREKISFTIWKATVITAWTKLKKSKLVTVCHILVTVEKM